MNQSYKGTIEIDKVECDTDFLKRFFFGESVDSDEVKTVKPKS